VALMEAMAAGKPVVASALSGVAELVEDGVNGLLVAPGDAEALAVALERLLDGPQVARSMGEQGRRKVAREFDLRETVAQLLKALDRHLQPPPAASGERLPTGEPTAGVEP
jgi:glycosyltransferase involved in cell wall biosynthesis